MKRWLFIGGVIIVIVLTGIWLALLFFGAPSKETIFNTFGFGDTTDPNAPVVITPTEPLVDVASPEQLRQLTLKPVIGHIYVQETASSTPFVYFTEAEQAMCSVSTYKPAKKLVYPISPFRWPNKLSSAETGLLLW